MNTAALSHVYSLCSISDFAEIAWIFIAEKTSVFILTPARNVVISIFREYSSNNVLIFLVKLQHENVEGLL